MRYITVAAPIAALLIAGAAFAHDHEGDRKGGRMAERLADRNDGQIEGLSAKPADVTAGTYAMDTTHVNVTWAVSHMGLSLYQGRFNDIDGTLTIDPANPEDASVSVTIKSDSVDTLSERLDEELRSEEGFKAEEFPEITFTSTAIKLKEGRDTHAKITGDLTMLGVTKEVTLHADFLGAGVHPFNKKETIGFQARGKIKRSDFGFTTWAPVVGDTVTLNIGAEFAKAE